jgi:phospholipid-translocating ATPase
MDAMSADKKPVAHEASAEKPGSHAAAEAAASRKDRMIATKLRQLYRKYVVQLVLRRHELPPSKDGRHIPLDLLHREDVLVDERRGRPYVSNAIRTSRYTLYDFLPKQIIFQFSRLANFYLLCVGVPQMIPGLSTTGSYTTIIPLLFFVALMVAKEGFDDWKRHRLDKVENARKVTVLRRASAGGLLEADAAAGFQWQEVKWRNVRVGDVIKLTRDEDVPADMVLLHADGDSGFAYVETMALDGETNLKSKQVSPAVEGCSTLKGIVDCRVEFVVEDPNPDLYRFDGRVTTGSKTLPLTLSEIVYRGSTVRNTPQAIGLVVNTGEECKIRKNANQHPDAKKPALEKVANKIVVTLAIYVIILSVGCSMGYVMWQKSTERNAWYIAIAPVKFVEIFMGFLIQFNNVIPLALYVSLEIVKLGQMFTLNWDVEMYDEASDTPARCNTNTILENLGQIGYVFSDKTGTLTENVMKFRKMSIVGTSWLHGAEDKKADMSAVQDTVDASGSPIPVFEPVVSEPTTTELLQYIRSNPASDFSKRATEYILAMALCHTCLPEVRDGEMTFQAASPDELALVQAAKDLGYLLVERSARSITLEVDSGNESKSRRIYEILDVIEFSSKRKRMSIVVRCPDGRIWLICKGADSTILPRLRLAHLALQQAHEVRKSVEMERELERTSMSYEPRNSFGGRPSLVLRRSGAIARVAASSIDISRSKSLDLRNGRKSADLLRPQVAVRAVSYTGSSMGGHGRPTNGGPGQPKEIPCPTDGAVFSQCFRHLDGFANEGLRTLLFAHRYVSEEDYALWKKVYNDATTSLVDRQERIEEAAELVEQSLELTGASAIEDKLQRGVPETIDRLRRANIKVWMLTGDKRETAINIAHSARICLPTSQLFILDVAKGDVEGQLREIMDVMQLDPLRHSVMVIDGATLAAIEEPTAAELQRLFYNLIPSVASVICCRASPAQKARLVRAIRANLSAPPPGRGPAILRSLFAPPNPLTLAIGDGANDLAMLAEAHVGVGISGKEGLQAARVADYAIAQFRFLARMLLVHGRWNYARTARFVLATFWKEMFFYLPTALYQRHNGYTGTSLYESWSLTVLNTLFTSLCVIVVGVWEQDLAAETLLAVPELYVFGQRNRGLGMAKYARWMAAAVAEGVFVWFACWAGYGYLFSPGRDEGLFALGNLVFSVAIMWINLKLL